MESIGAKGGGTVWLIIFLYKIGSVYELSSLGLSFQGSTCPSTHH